MGSEDCAHPTYYDEQEQVLRMAAAIGFSPEFVDTFRDLRQDSGTVGAAALEKRARVISDDIRTDPAFEQLRPVALAHGFVAGQATPLFTEDGRLLGTLSTYWASPHRPSERALRFLDLYAQLAVQAIERTRLTQADQEREQAREKVLLAEVGAALANLLTQADASRELKRQINELLHRLGEPSRYPESPASGGPSA